MLLFSTKVNLPSLKIDFLYLLSKITADFIFNFIFSTLKTWMSGENDEFVVQDHQSTKEIYVFKCDRKNVFRTEEDSTPPSSIRHSMEDFLVEWMHSMLYKFRNFIVNLPKPETCQYDLLMTITCIYSRFSLPPETYSFFLPFSFLL